MSNPPEVALWLTIPEGCWMRGELDVGDDLPRIHIMLGGNGDDTHVVFERVALERFVELAGRLLAVPVTPDEQVPEVLLVSSYGQDIREQEPHVRPSSRLSAYDGR